MPMPMLESNDPVVLREQFAAWMEGARSAACGYCGLHENPYEARSRKGDAWENGFEAIIDGIELRTPKAEQQQRVEALVESEADCRSSSDDALLVAGMRRAVAAISHGGMFRSSVAVATRGIGSVWVSVQKMGAGE